MKSVLLCERPELLKRVYREGELNALAEKADLSREIYSKSSVLQNRDRFSDVEFIFSSWGMPEFTEEELAEYLPSLRCVFYAAGSVRYFAEPFLKKGIRVFSAWKANAIPVAEYTLAQILLANKGFFATSGFRSSREREKADEAKGKYIGNYDACVGIIGVGSIGTLVVKLLKNHRLRVKVFDPFLSDERAQELGVTKCGLDEIFESCNVVSNHLANNEQTKNMLCGRLFEKLPAYATFINTGRGAQVIEAELCRVLKEREDLTALLDVTDPEPPLADSELYRLKNCILTPHIAGSSGAEVERMSEFMVEAFEKYRSGEECGYEVTLSMLDTMA